MSKPVHTRFYGLPLIGIGTPEVESLRSYLQRLSIAHNISIRRMCSEIAGTHAQNPNFLDLAFHGTGPVLRDFVENIGFSTGVPVHAASMGRFSEIFSSRGLVRTSRNDFRYCPLCVLEPANLEVRHGRLLWEIPCVTACPVHRVRLQLSAKCGAAKSAWVPKTQRPNAPAACAFCGSIGFGCHNEYEMAGPGDLWVASEVGALLSMRNDSVSELRAGRVIAGVGAVVDAVFDGKPVRAAIDSGLARATVLTWLKGHTRPELGALVKLAWAAGASLCSLLAGAFEPSQYGVTSDQPAFPPRSYRRHDWQAAHNALEDANRSCTRDTPSSLATTLGVDRSAMRRRFPKVCRALSDRAQERRCETDQSRYDVAYRGYTEAAKSLTERGRTITKVGLQRESRIWLYSSGGGHSRKAAMHDVLALFRPGLYRNAA